MTTRDASPGAPPDTSELAEADEDVLSALEREHDWVELPYLARSCDIDEEECWRVLLALAERGVARLLEPEDRLAGPRAAALTQDGQQLARSLGAVPPAGPVPEYVLGLSDLSRAALDATAEPQLRIGGAWTRRSQVRAAVRKRFPEVDIPTATRAIDDLLASGHLQVAGGAPEPQYQVTLRGLLASAWGSNALQIIGRVLEHLRACQESDLTVSRFSWRSLRRGAHLPYKTFNLAYVAIVSSGLGHGVFNDRADLWWAIQGELDVLLEYKTALHYVHTRLAPTPPPVAAPRTDTTSSGEGSMAATSPSIFISHAGDDVELAKALIGLLEAGLEAPTGTIRCTSVDGYKLEGGDDAPEVLRANLAGCAVVLGVLTHKSTASSYVLMELGAAWAFKKRAIPLIGPGATFRDLPGPFKDVHALKMANESDMSGLIKTVAKETRLTETNNFPKIVAALKHLTQTLGAPSGDATQPTPPPHEPASSAMPSASADMQDDEARVQLEAWLGHLAESVHSGRARSPQLRDVAEIAKEAAVPTGKVVLLAEVAQEHEHFGVTVKQLSGGKIHLDIGPARVRQVRNRRP